MKKYLFLLILGLSIQWTTGQTPQIVNNEVIVQLTTANDPKAVELAFASEMGMLPQFKHVQLLSKTMRIHLFTFDATRIDVYSVLRQLQHTDGVALAQVNHVLNERQIPNDSFFGQQWHHVQSGDHDIDTDLAWDITTGGLTAFGDEIVVCVVEGGGAKWDQADIVSNHWVNTNEIANNGLDDDNNGYIDDYDGWNIGSDTDNLDAGNHGTQVSSMIGAKGNNSLGITGVNWDVKIMQVQMGGVNENNVIEAYEYPLAMRKLYNQSNGTQGAFVVATNSSWGIDGGNPANAPLWCAMYDSLGYYGVLSAGSTANNNVNVDVVGDLPTACPSDFMISVTASNDNDVRTFSGYGITTIDIAAPGEDVYLAGNNSYAQTSGTSFAGPCVAGAIALLYSAPCNSFMEVAYAAPATAALDIKNYLMDGVDLVSNLSDEVVSGGRLNVNNSLQLLLNNCSEGACVAPFNVSASQLDQTLDYNLSWGSTASMLNFDIEYHETGSDLIFLIENVQTPSYTLTGLAPCTSYEAQIIAYCAEDASSSSQSLVWTTDGCCEHPTLPTLSSITDASASLSWNSVMAAMSYNVVVAQNGNTVLEYNNVTNNSLEIGPLEPCSQYTVFVSSNCGKIGPNPQSISFNTIGCGSCQDLTYCDVSSNANLEFIAEVSVDNYTHTSGSDGGYVFVEGSTITLANAATYDIALTPGFSNNQYNEYFKAWIDYNSNAVFENTELIFESENSSANPVSGSFTVPDNLTAGVTRMRVSMSYSSPFGGGNLPVDCGDGGDGEIEDYCVTLTGLPDQVASYSVDAMKVFPNPTSDILTLTNAPSNASFQVLDHTGRICLSGKLNPKQINVSDLSVGVYSVVVYSNNASQHTRFVKN